jgi:2-oxoglutarate ferredoxin oxidoreductase subunit alpha
MQARWGSHGDYEVIALCPQSPQEAFDLTIDAFNLAETYRVPVLLLLDECVGHMTEKVVIPDAGAIEVEPRRLTSKSPAEFEPYQLNGRPVPEFARAGDGYRFEIVRFEEDGTEDAEVVVISFGITARVARLAVETARERGIRAGFLRLIALWPFPEKRIRELADKVGGFLVPEINYGQMVLEVERCAAGKVPVAGVFHGGGGVHDPEAIVDAIVEAAS